MNVQGEKREGVRKKEKMASKQCRDIYYEDLGKMKKGKENWRKIILKKTREKASKNGSFLVINSSKIKNSVKRFLLGYKI